MSQSTTPTALSQPLDPLMVAANYFSLNCLQLSFQLLRNQHPALALSIQNITADLHLTNCNNYSDKLIAIDMDVNSVSKIVAALAELAEQSAHDSTDNQHSMIIIHQTLLDWLLYGQSFISEINPPGIAQPENVVDQK